MQPRLLDRDVLEVVDLRWVGQAEDPPDAGLGIRVGDLPVGEQLELLELLIDSHLREQAVHAPLDALTGGLPRGLQCRLVAGARGGDHPARDQQAKRDDRDHDRGVTSSRSHRSSSRCSAAQPATPTRESATPTPEVQTGPFRLLGSGTGLPMGIGRVWLRRRASLAGFVMLLVLAAGRRRPAAQWDRLSDERLRRGVDQAVEQGAVA